MLVKLTDYSTMLHYALDGYDGAMQHAYLDERALGRLNEAKKQLEELAPGYSLVIWDAYRTKTTQQAIYEEYVHDIMKQKSCDYDEACLLALEFVNPPNKIFPHGTGGTVDITLAIEGQLAHMGTDFDEFNERSYSDWFRRYPPKTDSDSDLEAHRNRELLRSVMETAGFVGLDSEWWHYEWGTRYWAQETGKNVILDKLLDYTM